MGYEKGHEGEVWWDIKLGKPGKGISKSQKDPDVEKQGRIKNRLYLQTRLFNQYAVPHATKSQHVNACSKLQKACLLLQIFWMFSVSGSHSSCALVDFCNMAIEILRQTDNGFSMQSGATNRI